MEEEDTSSLLEDEEDISDELVDEDDVISLEEVDKDDDVESILLLEQDSKAITETAKINIRFI